MKINNGKSSKSEQIKQQLLIFIEGQEEGCRLPSEPNLAKEYGVSRSTIGRSISHLETAGVLRRHQGSGTYIVRKPSFLELGKVPNIAFAISAHVYLGENTFYYEILAGAEAELSEKGGILAITRLPGEVSSYDNFNRQLTSFDGVILVGETAPSLLINLKNIGLDFVVLDSNPDIDDIDILATDNIQGAYEAVKYIIEQGWEKIGFFGCTDFISFKERFQGYRLALTEAGLPFNEKFNLQTSREYSEKDILELLQSIEMPEAFFCANDSYALGLIKNLQTLGYTIPSDINIVGFDDELITQYSSPGLTTMHVDKSRMGKLAVKKLLLSHEEKTIPQKLYLHSRLIERESVMKRR